MATLRDFLLTKQPLYRQLLSSPQVSIPTTRLRLQASDSYMGIRQLSFFDKFKQVNSYMAMAMRAAATNATAAPTGLRGIMYSTFSSGLPFSPPRVNQPTKEPPAEPSPNLFVSGLSKRTTTEGLHAAFAKFGEVVHARVVTDRNSGYSKGFGFVRYTTVEDAARGIKGMDGEFLDGWVIFAEYARPRPVPGQSENTYGRQ